MLRTPTNLQDAVTHLEDELAAFEGSLRELIAELVYCDPAETSTVLSAFQLEMRDVSRKLSEARSDLRTAQIHQMH